MRSTLGKKGLWYHDFSIDVLAASAARGLTVVAFCPLSVVKVQMENAAAFSERTVIGNLRKILQVSGVRGLFTGLEPMLLRDVPYTALAIPLYEQYSELLMLALGLEKRNKTVNFLGGTLGGLTACLLTQPFDVIKNRAMSGYKFGGEGYPGLLGGLKYVWRTEGARGFIKGLTVRSAERSLAQGLIWVYYCAFKAKLSG